MAFNVGTAYVDLKADVAGLRKDLAQAKKDLGKQTNLMQSQANRTRTAFRNMWTAIGGVAALYTVINTTSRAIKAASDLEETTSKFNVVFKNQTEIAEQWAQTLVEGYAMSTREARANLASIQDLLVPMGMAAEAAGKLSFEIVKLAADLGSFNNMPTERVMLDIQSALVGNFETMKKYGVVLNATLVQQTALNMGLAETKDELTAAHKAQAAYKLIIEGSQAAIGDMARTSDSYANTVKAAKATWEDFMASLGELILPAATKVVSGLAFIIDEINRLITTMDDMMLAEDPFGHIASSATTAAERTAALGDFFEVGGSAPTEQPRAVATESQEKVKEETTAALETKRKALEQEREIRLEHMEWINELRASKIEQFNEFNEAEMQLRNEDIQAAFRAEEYRQQELNRIFWQGAKARIDMTAQMFLTLSQLTNKYQTILFRAYQAFAIAKAIMAGKEAAIQAWKWGMETGGLPLAVAAAGASIAWTGAQIAAIVSASPPTAPGATAVAEAGPGLAATTPGAEIPEGEERGQLNIIIEGDVLADDYYIERLAEKISEAVEDKEVRLISSGTRAV